MRVIEEIKSDISRMQTEIRKNKEILDSYKDKYLEALEDKFKEEFNVKCGDKIKTISGEEVIYDHLSFLLGSNTIVAVCHPIKKDGKPCRNVKYLFLRKFDSFNNEFEKYLID